MANNRMWLVHVPSGYAVFLGKRMAVGWYTSHEGREAEHGKKIAALYEKVDEWCNENPDGWYKQDHYALAMEVCGEAPYAIDNWQYDGIGNHDEDGVYRLKITPAKS